MEIFTLNVLRPLKQTLLGGLFLLSALQPIRSEAATNSKKLVPENRNTGKLLFTPLNAPVMASFSPASGPVGTLVTITGTDLSDPTAITIGGVTAVVVSNTGSSLVAMVMPGATNGLIAVTTGGGTTTSTASFTVTASALPNSQQGAKMAGDGTGLLPRRGGSVSMTADGNMAIVGENKGAWIYTRNGSTWTKDQFQLVGSGVSGSIIAAAVSISADGNTAMIGGYYDNSDRGAIWFFTRNVSNNEWTQQGNKIVVGTSGAEFGWSVALSADGNTAISGAINDSGAKGAVYFFTRSSSGTWSPQSGKIVGTGGISIGQFGPKFGQSVALSADGNTAIVGGPNDNDGMGAVWFFTRTGDEWTQQNDKIIGNADMQSFGTSVSLSADGNTAIIGGGDYNGTGAAWVFTRTEDTWTQQGDILVGTGAIGNSAQGVAVSLSADGNTAIVGGPWDNESPTYKTAGAFWIYSRSTEGIWTQQGEKLIDAGGSTEAQFGADVALSADGSTAIVGGPADNGQKGSVWFFASTPPPAITSAAYDASAGELVVTGTDFVAAEGENNDIIANKFTLTGEGGATYTLTDSENPEITNTTSFTIALSTTDFAAVQSIFNKNGSSSAGETTYNLAATQGWTVGDIEDLLNNNVTVSHVGQTKVVAALCGATLTNIDGEVNANPVVQATAYRFRVTSGASVQTVDREENVFQLTQLGSFAYSTTYTIDVAAEVDGTWSAYGSVCDVTTPAPFSNISGFLCGTTLDNNMEIYAEHAPLATKYRFRVKHGSNEDFVEAEDGFFRMGEQSFFAYNTTYTIDVAVEVDGAWSDYGTACEVATTPNPTTKLVDAYCGETLENIDTEILADGLPLATHYRFRVSDGTNVQTVETEENFFQLTSLASFAYSTTYTIDVATEIDGGWTGYGTACEVTTPAPITKLASEFEDATLENMDAEIYADGLPLATGYRFRITNGASVQTIDKGQEENVFRMSQLPSFAYSTTYTIDVAAEIDGVWTAYGTAYNVSTPAPTTKIADEFCGKTLTTASGEIYADMPPLVTAYRFRVKEGENEQIIDSDSEYLNLSDLSFYAYNTTYTIDVAVEVEGVWSDYGTACEVTTTATPTTKLEDAYCGQTLGNIDTEIYADNVPLATQYRFRVTNGAEVQTIEKEENFFQLTELATFAYSTTYTIDAAAEIDGGWTGYGTACEVTTPAPITKLASEFEDATLENMDAEIYADGLPLATGYRFRITNGASVQTIDKGQEENVFRMSQLPSFAYSTTYLIDVAAEINGVWTAYGQAYSVSTPAPTTKIADEFCGTVLTTASGEIYADMPPLVTAYRFRVKEGENEQIIDTEDEYLHLSDLSFYAYNTAYTIDVAVEVDGVWSDYGTTCEVATTATPTTKLADDFNEKTLDNMDEEIYADGVPLATAYRFRVTEGANVQTIDKDQEENVFRMSQLPSFAYSTTYLIDVAAEIEGVWTAYGTAYNVSTPAPTTKIADEFCGKTLTAASGEIYADMPPLVTAYRFRLKEGGNEEIIDSESEYLRLSDLSFYAYNTTYTIDVAVEVDGVWSDYGTACKVTTVSTPTTKLEDAYCGQTLENIDTEIYADNVPLATNYRFRATEGANVQTIETDEPVIRMVHFPSFAYNTTYIIDVAVEVDGEWSDYGTAYDISTPVPPLTQIASEFCGTTLENINSEIYANSIYLATAYRFRVTHEADVQTMDTETGDFRLKEMSGIAYNTTYTIDVAVKVGGTWSAYGPACDVTMPTGIINISSSSPDGSYGIGSVIPIIVNFSSAVNVTGIPVLNLNSGGTATYTSGDESSALTFTYTVKADENADDLDYTDNHSLELSGGSIEDGNGHPVDLNLPDPDESGSLAANNDLVIDGTLPTLTDVVILSNNSNTALARTGDVVTVNFASSEALAVPEVTISGQTADVVLLQDNDWAATYTMTNDDTEGEILFSIAFSDVAGNAGTNVTATTNSSSVTFDPTTLPVSLIDYQVKLKNNSSIVITWLTTMERNNQGFELFKSIDGISFNKIATLKGNGNTEVANLYSFVDGSPAKGTNYYRLIQIDANGDRNEVGLKTIRFDFQEPNNVLVFPNPASDRVNITFEAGKFTSLTLIDLTGKTILQQPVNSAENKKTISLTGLPATTYLIRLSGQSETVSRLLIINH